MALAITTHNIEKFRGALLIKPGDLPFGVWDVFDEATFTSARGAEILRLERLVSEKDQTLDPAFLAGLKPDPRKTALEKMTAAAKGLIVRRGPLLGRPSAGGLFIVEDGNATAQALMLVAWEEVPVVWTRVVPAGPADRRLQCRS